MPQVPESTSFDVSRSWRRFYVGIAPRRLRRGRTLESDFIECEERVDDCKEYHNGPKQPCSIHEENANNGSQLGDETKNTKSIVDDLLDLLQIFVAETVITWVWLRYVEREEKMPFGASTGEHHVW